MELKNKRVLVVGLGKSGRSAALFLRDKGARVTVSDARSMAALQDDEVGRRGNFNRTPVTVAPPARSQKACPLYCR